MLIARTEQRWTPRRPGPNDDLIGKPESRAHLDTPCLLIDLGVLHANLKTGARMAHEAGKSFRPHVKAHKCIEIALLQQAVGVNGFCVATIGEAEIFAGIDHSGVLVTSTYATDRQIARVLDMLTNGHRIISVIDHPDFCERLSTATVARGLQAPVMIDLDMGRRRSGVPDARSARTLAEAIIRAPGLQLTGLQCYAGHLSHERSLTERRSGAAKASAHTRDALAAVREVHSGALTISGGSTGASMLDLRDTLMNELQWGSYALMDIEYLDLAYACDENGVPLPWPFEPALFVATRVIGTNAGDRLTIDAGHKRFASKYGAEPRVSRGAACGMPCIPISDEHGVLCIPSDRLASGSLLEVIVPHCDPTLNLFNEIHVVEGDVLLDIWPIDARGVF